MSRFAAGLVLIAACSHGGTTAAPTQTPQPQAAPAASQKPALKGLPPIIDREILFGDPEIAGGQLSPDGKFLTFRKQYKDVMNIWIKKIDEPFDAARPLTADTARPVRGYFWSEDSRWVLYVQDKGGDENFRVYGVDPTAKADPKTGVPPARDLTPFKNVRAQIIAVPEKTPQQILVGLNDRDEQVHDVWRLDLKTGKRQLVFKNTHNIAGWMADLDGKLRLGLRVTGDGATEILRVEGKQPKVIYQCNTEESCGPERFHKDGKRFYMVTNRGQPDLTRLVLMDVATGREELVDGDPDGQVDFGGAQFDDATEELVATYYVGDRLRTYPREAKFKRDYETVRKALPEGDVYFTSATEDEHLKLVTVTSDVDPGATYLYDRTSGKVQLLYRPYPKLPIQHLAAMKPVRFKARDGLEIPGYLTVPKGLAAQGLSAVVLPHGGPWGRDEWGYDPWAQFLANRGYVVLQPNFRGSAGYGKKFLNLGNGQWGTGTMQHDITDATRWLASQGIADARHIAIMGGSYGGYATLAGLTFTPDLYAAGVDIVGPSSILTLIRSIPPYWKPVQGLFRKRVGDVDNPKDAERLKAQSPLYSATNIKAPLLVIQGANDPRVKQAESDRIVAALRDLGRTVQYVVAPDEGHGFAGRENRLAMMAVIDRFLAQHIGGRYQESMPDAIAKKLATLTVDVKTVKAPAEARAAAGGGAAPAAPASFSGKEVRPLTLRYAQKAELGNGRTVEARATLSISRSKEKERSVWTVVEKTEGAMGAGADTTVLDAATLLPLRRSVKQGPATVELEFSERAVKGKIQASGQTMPIDAKLERPVLSDGAPLHLAIGTLPLAPGYKATLASFDLMSAAAKSYRLEVKGAEEVSVRAGTFPVYRVEVAPAEGGPGGSTLWVERKAPHRVIKWETALPMGAGKATAELEK